MSTITSYDEKTQILYSGRSSQKRPEGTEELPIYMTTAYAVKDSEDYEAACRGERYYYNREGNPNRDALSTVISDLEKGENSLICSSGMSAISTTLAALLKQGKRIVVNQSLYGETRKLLEQHFARYGVDVVYADFLDFDDLRRKLKEPTEIVYTEIITNPLIEVVDLRATTELAHIAGAKVVVDSTFTTPLLIRPLEFGADIVLHSLTKYFGGHGDLTGGSITANSELIEQIRPTQVLLGDCLDAFSCWQALRSIRTMELRVIRQNENALAIAKALSANPQVRAVLYPGLASHPQHELAQKTFHERYGAMLSFRVEDQREKVDQFFHSLKLIQYLGTLGGIRTSLAHPATAFRNAFTKTQLEAMGLSEGLIRISAGIEAPQDIIGDLIQALTVFGQAL